MSITSVKIRATISFGGISVSTPYILSFNVTKTRNSKSTFSASLKISSELLGGMNGNEVTIRAGSGGGSTPLIFTGYILSTRPSICFDDPNYTILNISGADILYKLEGQKYTRRQTSSKIKWASIESVTRRAVKGGKFQLVQAPVQLIEEDNISSEETKNKNKTGSDLVSLGQNTIPGNEKSIIFAFGPVTFTEAQS